MVQDEPTHFIKEQSVMTVCGAPIASSDVTEDESLVDCQGCRYYLHMREQRRQEDRDAVWRETMNREPGQE